MNRWKSLAMLAAVGAGMGACTGVGEGATARQVALVRQAIESQYRAMEAAFKRGDADAIARMYTDDAAWYVPEARVIKGRDAIARAWKAQVGNGGNALRVDVDEVELVDERAHEIGRFTISAPDGGVVGAGKYLVIWARQDDGTWKTHRDIFNWDVPPVRP